MKLSTALIGLMMVAVVAASTNSRPSRGFKRYSPYPEPTYSYSTYAYPPSPYSFAYAVKDEPLYNDFGHSENSDGKTVAGTYHVVLPDGRKQSVDYKVDAYSGYVADVKYEGIAYHSVAASYSPPAVPVAFYFKEVAQAPAVESAPVEAPAITATAPAYGTKIEVIAPVKKEAEPAADPAPVEAAPAVKAEATPTEAALEVEVAPAQVPAKTEWTESAATEAAPAEVSEVAPSTEVPAGFLAEVVVPAEKIEWTEPIVNTEATKGAKRSYYQRSRIVSTPVSNEQRYYASRIRKRQPTAISNTH